MKRNLFVATVFALCLTFVSCGGSETKGSENVDSKSDANKIISYTNDVIDYLNGSGDWMRTNESRISGVLTFVETKKKPTVLLPFMPSMSFDMGAGKKDVTNPPSVMSAEEQAFFKDNMTAYKEKYTKFKENCVTLHKYLQNEDYKDDDFAKGKELAAAINADHSFLVESKNALYDKIDTVTEKAENIILEDLPLRDPILALKAELNNMQELSEAFYSYSEGKLTPEQVDAEYKEVAASIEKNKDAHTAILEENNAKSTYDSFYKRAEESLATYRKTLREVKAKKELGERDFKNFNSNYNSLINAYNNFVK